MDLMLTAILLGIVEGLTEFIPVSSTGHLILASELLGYDAKTWAVFNVVIQFGAILAVVVQYWRTFWAVGMGLLRLEALSLRFVLNLLVAFIPAVVLGLLFKHQIDAMLGSPRMRQAFGVGLLQCLAMVPGVSRSGATIMGALAMGINRRTAAEFSFFLAIPTMLGASTLELWQNRAELAAGTGPVGWSHIAVGFIVAFVVALVVIKVFVAYVSRAGFTPFALYRIVAGMAALYFLSH
jgi:undecaprenyl-diphosphatase